MLSFVDLVLSVVGGVEEEQRQQLMAAVANVVGTCVVDVKEVQSSALVKGLTERREGLTALLQTKSPDVDPSLVVRIEGLLG